MCWGDGLKQLFKAVQVGQQLRNQRVVRKKVSLVIHWEQFSEFNES